MVPRPLSLSEGWQPYVELTYQRALAARRPKPHRELWNCSGKMLPAQQNCGFFGLPDNSDVSVAPAVSAESADLTAGHDCFSTLRPEWYVFPLSNRTRPPDPNRPVTSLKTAGITVRDVAGVKCRLHDLRRSFCTKLAEAGAPDSTMLDMMGHISPVMLRRYSHIRAKARREAIAAIEDRASFGLVKVSPKVSDSAKNEPTASD
jgi:hypothetical protein